ncbi:hypothetical protein MA16_Dca026648 [Dendrobium catenatum]|uniref:Uncharacterized protein n=1 Tax=Dendrobium catenatum TaxID=906689 RepID=A0A2I0WZY5_9ASPA|nr:hypothetical protein MA16_Dca026648 [Dendrobium catenatum]
MEIACARLGRRQGRLSTSDRRTTTYSRLLFLIKDWFAYLRLSRPVLEEQCRECGALGSARSHSARGGRIGAQGTGEGHTSYWLDAAVHCMGL